MSISSDHLSIPLLEGGSPQSRLFWRLFASSVRRLGFSMPGKPGKKRNEARGDVSPLCDSEPDYGAMDTIHTSYARLLSRVAREQCAEASEPNGRLLQSNVEVRIEEEV